MFSREDIESAKKILFDSGFVVFEKLEENVHSVYNEDDSCPGKRMALLIDFETTGLTDIKPIEIGLLLVEYSSISGKLYKIVDSYVGFEDPLTPISEKISKFTGIRDDMVWGDSFDDAKVNELINRASVIIAHNAKFVRKVAEQRFSLTIDKPWMCSFSQIDWEKYGIVTKTLRSLCIDYMFVFKSNRALSDVLALAKILSEKLPSSENLVFMELLKNGRLSTNRVWALESPYDKRNLLKERGYIWSDGLNTRYKGWSIDVKDSEVENELDFLKTFIYKRKKLPVKIIQVTPFDRFSIRE